MLYGYKRPSNPTFTLAGDSTPAFETDIRLSNSQPSEQTVISGVGESSPTTSQYFDVMMDWAAPQSIGAIMLLNLSCPAGTRVVVTGRRLGDSGYAQDLGGNSDSRTVYIPEGERIQLVVAPSASFDDLIGLQFRFYNDANSSTWADDTTDFYIGEIAAYATVRLCDAPRRSRGRTQRAVSERAVNGALHAAWRGNFRTLSLTIRSTVENTHLGGLDGVDIDTLVALQDGPFYRAAILQRGTKQGEFDYALINRTAMFAWVKWGNSTEEEAVGHMNVPLDIEECP